MTRGSPDHSGASEMSFNASNPGGNTPEYKPVGVMSKHIATQRKSVLMLPTFITANSHKPTGSKFTFLLLRLSNLLGSLSCWPVTPRENFIDQSVQWPSNNTISRCRATTAGLAFVCQETTYKLRGSFSPSLMSAVIYAAISGVGAIAASKGNSTMVETFLLIISVAIDSRDNAIWHVLSHVHVHVATRANLWDDILVRLVQSEMEVDGLVDSLNNLAVADDNGFVGQTGVQIS